MNDPIVNICCLAVAGLLSMAALCVCITENATRIVQAIDRSNKEPDHD